MDVVRIRPKVQEYDWGNVSFIPELLGSEIDGKPKAEVWFGTHPAGEATIPDMDDIPLGKFLADHADIYFGPAHIQRFGVELPLLLKVLAIEKPLSIQCHPSTSQAEAGYQKEQNIRQTLPKDQWNYKDANRKAEVIYALTPVTAMCAFRPLAQIDAAMRMLLPASYEKYFSKIAGEATKAIAGGDQRECDKVISTLFERLYTLDKPSLKECIVEYLASLHAHDELLLATPDGNFLEPKGIVLSCCEEYPEDPGLFCPFLLNVMHLEPGEALFLKPKTLHAYVLGNGIELMSASDNVLRGGLTHKKVDVPELMRVLQVEGGVPERTPTVLGAFGRRYILTPTEEFVLLKMDSGSYEVSGRTSIEMMLCTDGSATLSASGESFTLKKGECCVVAAGIPSYKLEVKGTVFSAAVPADFS